jgi:hypothetical protein
MNRETWRWHANHTDWVAEQLMVALKRMQAGEPVADLMLTAANELRLVSMDIRRDLLGGSNA